MLKRKILRQLDDWRQSPHKKAMILTGARQVGKTTAVRQFAAAHYSHFVEINFVRSPQAQQAFDGELDAATIVINLSAMGFGPFVAGETLVFFDEIQECPNARTAIKFLVEDGRFDYIESGSLLGINYKPVKSYPVGFEQEVAVYPLDFEEFMWAKGVGEDVISLLRDCYQRLRPVPEFVHRQISKIYREYLIVGGMPEVVNQFVSNPDFGEVVKLQQSIIHTYRDDVAHYAGARSAEVKRVFDAIPSQLGKEDKRFVLARLEAGAAFRKYEEPTQWLVDAGLAYYSLNVKSLELPFESLESRNLFKLYMVDTGLLCSMLLPEMQFQVLNGDININEGALTENFVACALASKGRSLHYYDKKSRQEIDFVLADGDGLAMIEVKSGDNYRRHASLDAAIAASRMKVARAVVLSKFNVEVADDVTYLPLYMAEFLFRSRS